MEMVTRMAINQVRHRWFATPLYSDGFAGDAVPFETKDEAIAYAKRVCPLLTIEPGQRRNQWAPEPDL